MQITKEFGFEMAHALEGYDGACSQIHGHSYRLFVTLEGTPETDTGSPKVGMVMDFGQLKRLVERVVIAPYDHTFLIRRTPANEEVRRVLKAHFQGIHEVDFQPTCEALAELFARAITGELPPQVRLVALRLYETATSMAEWKNSF